MERAQLKKWGIFIGSVTVLVLIWSIMIEFFDSSDYLSEHFYNPFLFYIPLSLFTVSAVLYIIQMIIEYKKPVIILSLTFFAVLILYCTTVYGLISYYTLKPENIEKYENIKETVAASNAIIPSEQFVPKEGATYDSDDYFALNNMFLYSGEHQYTYEDTRVTIETYYFENFPKLRRKKLLEELRRRELYKDSVEGTQNGINYQYCYNETMRHSTSSMFQIKIKCESYFAVIIENGDDILLVSMDFYYKDFDFDAQSTVENLISEFESMQEVQV